MVRVQPLDEATLPAKAGMNARASVQPTATDAPLRIALPGPSSCGKTALFNLLTGARQKVANYAGVTVERKEGLLQERCGPQCAGAGPARRLQPARAQAWTKPSRVTSCAVGARGERLPMCWSTADRYYLR